MLTIDHLRTVLRQHADETSHAVDLLVIGGMAIPPVPQSTWTANCPAVYGHWLNS